MNKKWLAPLVAVCLLGYPARAAVPTLAERSERVEAVVYGEPGTGALLDRMDRVEREVYGGKLSSAGLAAQVNTLYNDVVRSSTTEPSLATRVNTLEWQLRNQISTGALVDRVRLTEEELYGAAQHGALSARVLGLEGSVYQDRHYELREVELPANTVFRIRLADGVSTKESHEGDVVNFAVAQDVFVDDVLVLPRGARGEGLVTKVKPPRSFGRAGELEIAFNQVFGIDDEPIATVLGAESREKLKHEAAAIGASAAGAMLLGPIGLVGGFFVKGARAEMPAGTELYIQVQDTIVAHGVVAVDGAPQATKRDVIATKEKTARQDELNAETKERTRNSDRAAVVAEGEDEARDAAELRAATRAAADEGRDEEVSEESEETVTAEKPALRKERDEVRVYTDKKKAAASEKADSAERELRDAADEAKSSAVTIEEIEDHHDEEHLPVVEVRQE